MSIAVALALGFIIGTSLTGLKQAILACAAAGTLTSLCFVLLPYTWNDKPAVLGEIAFALVFDAVVFSAFAALGMYLGRRRAQRAQGPTSRF